MRVQRCAPAALGTACLLLAASCTGGDEPPDPPPSPDPIPTAYTGEAPPGLDMEPLRWLHGADSESILNDSKGVRVQPVGDAFLISSNSDERHMLQRAADGETLWEGEERIERFTTDRAGEAAFTITSDADPPEMATISHAGEELWSSEDPRERFVEGWVVRYPSSQAETEPYGEYTIADTAGAEVWSYSFVEPEDSDVADESDEDEPGDPEDTEWLGAPIGTVGDTVFLSDGSGQLQAHSLDDEGELLWNATGSDMSGPAAEALPPIAPNPQLVDTYIVSVGEDDDGEAERERAAVLVRWGYPEEPSLLSMLDLDSGEPLWSLRETGANPVDHPLSPVPVVGTVYDAATETLLVPQSSGATPYIAVDLTEGTVRWQFDDDEERAISPAFAVNSYIYGDTREPDDSSAQVVLDAETKDTVAEDPDGYVEAVTEDGYALVVHDRQRFVFPVAE